MIRLAQYLCHNRHCLIAAAFDDSKAKLSEAEVKKLLELRLKELGADPWCGICASMSFHVEIDNTKFKSMEQVMPILKRAELMNLLTRELAKRAKNQ